MMIVIFYNEKIILIHLAVKTKKDDNIPSYNYNTNSIWCIQNMAYFNKYKGNLCDRCKNE